MKDFLDIYGRLSGKFIIYTITALPLVVIIMLKKH